MFDVCWCLDDSLMILFELSSIMYESYRSIPLDMIGHTRTLPSKFDPNYIICRRYSRHSRNASCMMCQPPSPQVATRSERGRSCVSRSCTASGSMKARGPAIIKCNIFIVLGGYSQYFLCSPLFVEDSWRFPFWLIFFRWVEITTYRIHLYQVR